MGCLKKVWTPLRDTVETAATLAGNYYLPGSSLLTDRLVSKGSQKQLNTPLGKIANIGSGLAGSGFGSGTTGIPSASDVGGGWTNLANKAGGLVGAGGIGTDIADAVNTGVNSVGEGVSNALSGIGHATGLSDLLGTSSSTPAGLLPSSAGNGSTVAENSFLAKAGASPAARSFLDSAGSSLGAGVGGGASAYSSGGGMANIGTLSALLGGANSLSATKKARQDLLDAQNNSLNTLQPYLASGGAANARLSDLLGTSSNTAASGYGDLTQPFNPGDLTSDPGYQFQLSQGNQALDRSQSARGGYFSGAALKAAQDYGVGLADTTYKDAFARDQAQKAQQYGMFSGQAGAGQQAAGTAADIYGNIGNARANAGIAGSNIINSTLSSLLNGSGAKRPVNVGGQIYYV